jgi:hypothetical protein
VRRHFDGNGIDLLRLRTSDGLLNAITTIDAEGIQVDTTGDGSLDTTFDPSTESWVIPEPYNAAEASQPWDALRLLPHAGATASVGEVLRVFPEGRHNVAVLGTWGWPAVPDLIRELTIKLARDLRDSLEAGATGELQALDSGVVVRGDTWRFWKRAEARYSHRLPGIA